MSVQLLLILRVGLLALVYLTFFRVLRAVWVELRAESGVGIAAPVAVPAAAAKPAPTPAAPRPTAPVDGGSSSGGRLVVLAPEALAGAVFNLEPETTIGRAPGCGVVVDDARVSKLHARIFHAGGRWVVEDLGSTNGTLVNDQLLGLAQNVGPGDRIQVGDHVLELA